MGGHKHIGRRHRHSSVDYYACQSGLKEWNAAYKVFFTVLSLITVIAADSLPLSLMTTLYMGGISCIIGRIKAGDYIRFLLIPLTFILMSTIAVLIQFGSGTESIVCMPFFSTQLYITGAGLRQAADLSFRAVGAVSCLYLLTLSTPMGEIINVLHSLHVPNLILELMHFIYRYLFILIEMNSRQKEAVLSRLGYCDKRTAIRSFGSEIANLFIVSMGRAQDYYDALESRGYEGNCLFYEEKKKMTGGQAVWGILYFASVILILGSGIG